MWEKEVGRQIRRCNRNLLLVNFGRLIGVLNRRYLLNYARGTAPRTCAPSWAARPARTII